MQCGSMSVQVPCWFRFHVLLSLKGFSFVSLTLVCHFIGVAHFTFERQEEQLWIAQMCFEKILTCAMGWAFHGENSSMCEIKAR